MTSFRVDVEGHSKPYVCVELEQDHEPTDDEIDVALNKLAEEISFEGYVAEMVVNSGYIVTNVERYGP